MKNRGRDNKNKRMSTYEIYDLDDSYADSLPPSVGTFFSSSARKKTRTKAASPDEVQSADKLLDAVLFRAAEKNLQLMQDQADNAAQAARDGNISYETVIKPAVEGTGEVLADIEAKVNTRLLANNTLMKQLKSYKGDAAAHVKDVLEKLSGISKEDFDEVDIKKISALINSLQQMAFKMQHEVFTKTKLFQKHEQAKAKQILDSLGTVVQELGANQKQINIYKKQIGDYRKAFLDPLNKTSAAVQANLKRAETEFISIYAAHRQGGGELKLESPAALDLVLKHKALPETIESPKMRK